MVDTLLVQRECEGLVLATGNPHKLAELADLLAPLRIPLYSLTDFPGVQTVVEDGATLAENARRKASGYARQLDRCVLADDTGLEVDALGGVPGVRSARYAGRQATMAENRARLLADLNHVPLAQRTAKFVCHLAVANPRGGIVVEAAGECPGRILLEPMGQGGFGYDALFEVDGYGRTLAQLDAAASAAVGHRGRAVSRLLAVWENPPGCAGRSRDGHWAIPKGV
jgi:XTP/dITP diphosphohydrolase